MKRRILTLALLSLLLLSFIGCNADATAGLFRQLANAKEPVKIRYKQIVGLSSNDQDLYFLTDEGVFTKNSVTEITKVVVKNKSEFIVEAAALLADNLLYILVNGPKDSALLYTCDPADPDSLAPLAVSDYALKGIYTNSLVRAVQISDNTTHLGTVNSANGVFTSSLDLSSLDAGNYVTLLLQPGKKHEDIGNANPLLAVYFDPATETYTTYYHEGISSYKLTGITSQPATFTLLDNKLFVITKTGILYGSNTLPAGETAMIELAKLNREYDSNAFIYGIADGDTYNLITKSRRANEGFTVLKFAKTIFSADPKKVDAIHVADGFGDHFTNVTIVDALLLNPAAHKFLVATLSHGMMSVTFTALDAENKNSGSATAGEEYEF